MSLIIHCCIKFLINYHNIWIQHVLNVFNTTYIVFIEYGSCFDQLIHPGCFANSAFILLLCTFLSSSLYYGWALYAEQISWKSIPFALCSAILLYVPCFGTTIDKDNYSSLMGWGETSCLWSYKPLIWSHAQGVWNC